MRTCNDSSRCSMGSIAATTAAQRWTQGFHVSLFALLNHGIDLQMWIVHQLLIPMNRLAQQFWGSSAERRDPAPHNLL
jgi:hypothetical protein